MENFENLEFEVEVLEERKVEETNEKEFLSRYLRLGREEAE